MIGKWRPSPSGAGELLEGAAFHAVIHDGSNTAAEITSPNHSKITWAVRRNADREIVARGDLGGWGYSALDAQRDLRPAARRLARSALKVFEDIEDSRADDQDID